MRSAPLDFDSLHAALRAAGEGTRLRVLALLAEADLTVSDLTKILRQSQPRISRHLKLLAEAGLVDRFREGSWAFYRLGERGGVADIAQMLIGRLDQQDRKSTRLNSSHDQISYAVFCLKKNDQQDRKSTRLNSSHDQISYAVFSL